MRNARLTLLILPAVWVAAGMAHGELTGQLGLLTSATLAGNNPATGAPWADGDQYRLVFHTSTTTTANSPDIATYNAWVQGLADASSIYNIGAGDGVTWKVIGSTDAIDARDIHAGARKPSRPRCAPTRHDTPPAAPPTRSDPAPPQ